MRTLVCVLCQVRNADITWPKFKENVLDVLGADLALCISADSNIKASGKVVGVASEDNGFFNTAKHVFRYEETDDWAVAWDEMTEGRWRQFHEIPGDWLGGVKTPTPHVSSGAIGTFYRWLLAKNLVAKNLLAEYDQVIITRSDYYWQKPHPVLDLDHVWLPNGEFHFGITDRHMVLPSNLVEKFLGIGGTLGPEHYDAFSKYYADSQFFRRFGVNLEGYIWFLYNHTGIHTKLGFFPQKMFVIAPAPPPQNGVMLKYPDEYDSVLAPEGDLITWPYEIDHAHMSRHSMFVGNLKSM